VGTASPSESAEQLAQLMVGRPVELGTARQRIDSKEEVLSVTDLTIKNHLGAVVVKSASFSVNKGEVFAVAGVQGNGQTELARAIINLEKPISGSIKLNGEEISGGSIKSALNSGIAYIPESRELDGLVGGFTIYENLILDVVDEPQFSKIGMLNQSAIENFAAEKQKLFDIRAQDISSPASALSGGNKQKVVLARELSKNVSLVVASQPTRGLDIGSIEFVHKKILEQRAAGKAVLLFSTELDEIYALADRIAVMYKGEIIDIVKPDTPPNKIGMLMAGVR
jgi:simple sugar transport system ATP-binding protein